MSSQEEYTGSQMKAGTSSSSPPPSRDSSPVRKPKTKRERTCPVGFRRSCCPCGHACIEPKCYTNIRNTHIIWDKSKYEKAFYPAKYTKWRNNSKKGANVPLEGANVPSGKAQ